MSAFALQHQPADDAHVRPTGGRAEVVPLHRRGADALDTADPSRRGAPEPLVLRPQLFERLAAATRVTLVSAPAGSGKTSLLRSWIANTGLGARVAWATVRREEHDGQRFWDSVTRALAAIADDAPPVARIAEARASMGDLLVDRLDGHLPAIDEPTLLVIDDLHELTSADALAALERLLAHLPAHLRVVLLTRLDPGLGLHRLRLAGSLTELRGADLRFSLQETRELLVTESGIALSDQGVADLHERTEGWAAGLRLATIALARHPEPDRFVTEFCGSERTVAAFLQAEVLDRQPPEVRDLLLRTSVLECTNGALADALTGCSGSLRILHELEEANAFVEAVDVGRSWFRCHRLFSDLLRRELGRVDPGLVGSLHQAAARWFERHGDPVDAIRHAQTAGDWVEAARLLADHQLDLTLDGRTAEIRRLLAAFPPDAAAADPELAVVVATTLLADGLHDEAAAHIAAAELLAATVRGDRRPMFDLALAATALRLACARGDMAGVPRAVRCIEAALRAQSPSDFRRTQTPRAAALVDMGIAELRSLRLPEARRHLEQALELARRLERPSIEIACLSYLALEATLSGRPATVARPLVEQAASLVESSGNATPESVVTAFAAGASTLLSLGRFVEAERWLERAQRALEPGTSPGLEVLVQHTGGLLHLAQERLEDALPALRDAERLQERMASEHPLALDLRGRVLLAQVRLGETAAVRAALAGMSEDVRGRAEIRIAAAALELSERRAEQAADELRPVLEGTARARCNTLAATIEALLYDAAAQRELGDTSAAEASLERALELAEPEGILLPFALADARELLERHGGHRTAHASLRSAILDLLAGSAPTSEAALLLEPLSKAELRVVRFLPGNLRGPEIAAELCVSPNTIRSHLRHIYAKLDVHTRKDAVARARQLGLLAPA